MSQIDFTPQEESRYARHDLIEWWDQRKVSSAHYIVAGAGALGNEVLKLLALIGVGRITLIDFDVVSRSNLARMVLFREEDVGKPKALVAAQRVREINPAVEVVPIQGDLRTDLGLGDYRTANLVFGCLDSVNARWALNRRCLRAGAEWLDGGISDYHGLVARYGVPGHACYECNFTNRTYERFSRRYSCPFGLVSTTAEPKVPTTAVTTSMIAALQVQQAMLMLHEAPEALQPGERLMIYMKPYGMVRDRLPHNPDCQAHDPLPRIVTRLNMPTEATVGDVLVAASQVNPTISGLELPFEWVPYFICDSCGARQDVRKPKEKIIQAEAVCPQCQSLRRPEIIESVSCKSEWEHVKLKDLGIPLHEILAFQTDEEPVFMQIND